MKAIKVETKNAQKIKEVLIKHQLLNRDYKVIKEKNYIYFPLVNDTKQFKTINKTFKKYNKIELKNTPNSYDVIGDILIFESQGKDDKKIAKEFLKKNNIKVVARRMGHHEGIFRTQKIEILAGENRKETTHKESNIRLKLNIEKVYFSPRSSNERLRIAKLVKPKENILVMFSGCGPFQLVLAKNTKANLIYGIELNKIAHAYAEENIKLNKIKNVKNFCNDIKKQKLNLKFDRIIMPLPHTADGFLDIAIKHSHKGTIIHLYKFESEENLPNYIKSLENRFKNIKTKKITKTGQFNPKFDRYCFDLLVKE